MQIKYRHHDSPPHIGLSARDYYQALNSEGFFYLEHIHLQIWGFSCVGWKGVLFKRICLGTRVLAVAEGKM